MRNVRFTNAEGLQLAGVLHPSPSDTVLVMSHGFTGDKDEWGFFERVAKDVCEAGFGVFRFDFAGCGQSTDYVLTLKQQSSDLSAAIAFVLQEGYTRVFLYGHSLGGYVSLLHHAQASGIIASAPVTTGVSDWSGKYSSEQLAQFHEQGFLVKTRDKGVRKKIVISEQILRERETVTQDFLAEISCPVLLIHGNKDESVLLADSLNAITYLSDDSDLRILSGADHDFMGFWPDISALVIEWIQKHS